MTIKPGTLQDRATSNDRWWADRRLRPGLVITLGLGLVALLAQVIAPGDPAALGDAADRLAAPSGSHLLGTDLLGRDVLMRLVHGSRVSLLVG